MTQTLKKNPAPKHKPAKAAKRAATSKPDRKPARVIAAPAPAPKSGAPGLEGSKQTQLIALMQRPTGSTIEEMTALTGWKSHSVRGVISGVLRKKLGLNVACVATDGAHRYQIRDAK